MKNSNHETNWCQSRSQCFDVWWIHARPDFRLQLERQAQVLSWDRVTLIRCMCMHTIVHTCAMCICVTSIESPLTIDFGVLRAEVSGLSGLMMNGKRLQISCCRGDKIRLRVFITWPMNTQSDRFETLDDEIIQALACICFTLELFVASHLNFSRVYLFRFTTRFQTDFGLYRRFAESILRINRALLFTETRIGF